MSIPRNTVVLFVLFFLHNYLAAVVKASNITLKDLEIMNKTNSQIPDLEIGSTNFTAKYNDDNFSKKIKRMFYDEVDVVQQARDMPPKKIFGMYTKLWSDLFAPTYESVLLYPTQFAEMFKKMYLRLKEP